jgi:hypothetical protein
VHVHVISCTAHGSRLTCTLTAHVAVHVIALPSVPDNR